MNKKLELSLENIVPFLLFGIAIALAIGLLILLSRVVIWGVLIGGLLWAIWTIKKFFSSSNTPKATLKTKGRIIEHNDKD